MNNETHRNSIHSHHAARIACPKDIGTKLATALVPKDQNLSELVAEFEASSNQLATWIGHALKCCVDKDVSSTDGVRDFFICLRFLATKLGFPYHLILLIAYIEDSALRHSQIK